jgi:hypothetical protein
VKGRKGAGPSTEAATGTSGKNSGVANLTPFKPGQSGNLAGRHQGDGLMRKRLMKSFLANEKVDVGRVLLPLIHALTGTASPPPPTGNSH